MPRAQYLKHEPIECLLNPPSDVKQAIEALYQSIVTFAAKALQADACSAFLVDHARDMEIQQVAGTGHQERFRGPTGRKAVSASDVVEDPQDAAEKLGMTAWIASTGRPLLTRTEKEFYDHPHHLGDHDAKLGLSGSRRIRTFLGVPIRGSQQDVIGVIKAERCVGKGQDDVPAFSDKDEASLSSIAVAAGRCLDYVELATAPEADGPRDAVTAWTSDVVSMAASAEPDLSSFANVVAEVMAAATRADSCSIFLLDEVEGRYLTQVGGCGYQARGNLIRAYRMPEADDDTCGSLTTYIAVTGEEVYLRTNEELRGHEAWAGQYDDANFSSGEYCTAFLGVPIRVGATTLGVLKLENSSNGDRAGEPDPFPGDVQRQVSILVQAIALSIFRLRAQASERYAEIGEATKSINKIMLEGGDLQGLVKRAISTISELMRAKACSLFIVEGADRLVQHPWGAYGYATTMGDKQQRMYRLVSKDDIKQVPNRKDKVGLTVWIAATGRKFVAKTNGELRSHPHHLGVYDKDNFAPGQCCDSFIGVPLRVGQATVGVLKIENRTDEHGTHVPFTSADEFVVDMLAGSLANAVDRMSKRPGKNRDDFLNGEAGRGVRNTRTMWALGLKVGKRGLRKFDIDVPDLPDDSVVVRTHYLGICGTDVSSLGGSVREEYDLVEFHEAVGEVVWTGEAVSGHDIQIGDIVVPVVRRCQEWDKPSKSDPVTFNFRPCKEASRCSAYRRPDACPRGEYPYELGEEFVGYRSRGTGRCHGFGSQFWVDTPEWLVRVCSGEEKSHPKSEFSEEFIERLVLVEPLAVVWKMKREIENVRAVRPFQDRMLTLGVGPIGWLATAVMRDMYPGLRTTAVDRVPSDRKWIRCLQKVYGTDYRELGVRAKWHRTLTRQSDRFDIIVEATGNPQHVIKKAIEILAPNGILVLLSVVGREGQPSVSLDGDALNSIVKKNAKIIGSVNESRDDFENAVSYLRGFHSDEFSALDPLIHKLPLDPPKWKVLGSITQHGSASPKVRSTGPKVVLKA